VARWIAGLALLTGLGSGFALWRPDLSVVQDVRFHGAERATPIALRHLADLPNGTHVWFVDPRVVEDGLERHPWVREAQAELDWRGVVHVGIDEYEPVALVRHQTGLFYVDRFGTVFLRARTDDLDYPILSGLDEPALQAHPDLPRLAVRDALWLVRTVEQRGLASADDVLEVAFSATRGFTVQLDGASIVFGLEDLPERMERLASLVGQGLDLSAPILVDLGPARSAVVHNLDKTHSEG
jgi:cell division septal protein FtsQ